MDLLRRRHCSGVYDYWKKLPFDQRPELYLHELSLGAFNFQRYFFLIFWRILSMALADQQS
ncbi:alpha/beta-hydrolase family protein [Ochrobactrum quorumnocens]|uniref:Alpha/beta-hydrolase catalytic domain-containing protein n=1 Tax=Ochrobactrum quorumnocens TaxID=271865 RepID=A0A5N1JMJ8_9HYPH|nr:hypothetical protein F3W84_22430 [[Ochrobactrum] quorumnocens]